MFKVQHFIPTRLLLEENCFARIGEVCREFGDAAVIVAGKSSMEKHGTLGKMVKLLEESHISTFVISGISTNPLWEKISEGAKAVRKRKPDLLIALGGGSVIDAAKAISLAATHEGDFWEYRITGSKGVGQIKDILIPLVAIPTVFGTGSEISPAALIRKSLSKEIIVSPYMFPKLALVDPRLAITAPPRLTAEVGCDAFIQGMEAYLSSDSQPMSEAFAREAMRLCALYLPRCYQNPEDIESRANMAIAALLSIHAVSMAGVGAVHALSDPLSGRCNVHHGLALATLTVEVMKVNLSVCEEKYMEIARILGSDTANLSSHDAALEAVSRVESFLGAIGLGRDRLSEFGVRPDQIPTLSKEAQNPDMTTNPKKLDEAQISEVYQRLL